MISLLQLETMFTYILMEIYIHTYWCRFNRIKCFGVGGRVHRGLIERSPSPADYT